jgi:hypothetical protein
MGAEQCFAIPGIYAVASGQHLMLAALGDDRIAFACDPQTRERRVGGQALAFAHDVADRLFIACF